MDLDFIHSIFSRQYYVKDNEITIGRELHSSRNQESLVRVSCAVSRRQHLSAFYSSNVDSLSLDELQR